MHSTWQRLILARWNPLLGDVPAESIVFDHQQEYYARLRESTSRGDSATFVAFMLRKIDLAVHGENGLHAPEFTPQVSPQDAARVGPAIIPQIGALLRVLRGEASREELQLALGLRDRKSFRARYLLPALALGLIERTIPGKPSSRSQRYRLTPHGRLVRHRLQSR